NQFRENIITGRDCQSGRDTMAGRTSLIMRTTLAVLTAAIATAVLPGGAPAQQPRKSPHETVSPAVKGGTITITYGRPSIRGRKIMGGLVPYGEVWRTGADEATTLETGADLKIGSLDVPKGTYALFTLPAADGWQMIVNKTAKQWG